MSRIRGKMNLAKLVSVVRKRKTKSGEEIDVLIIPIKKNNLYLSQKGAVYLDIVAFESGSIKEYTHMVKQSIGGDVYKAMTDQEKRDKPILGNLEYIGDSPAPTQTASADLPKEDIVEDTEPSDDLPF